MYEYIDFGVENVILGILVWMGSKYLSVDVLNGFSRGFIRMIWDFFGDIFFWYKVVLS